MVFDELFYEVASLLLLAAAVGALGLLLRQPLIVAFIAVGILAGPSVFGLIRSHDPMELLAEMGIALLLFVVGLKLDVQMIRTMGPVALATGLGQVAFTSLFGFLIARGLGLEMVPALYVAVALTFSSTIIIVKLLSDKHEVDSLHGRIAIGFLIVQDLAVVIALIALTALGGGAEEEPLASRALVTLGRGLGFLAVIALLMRWGLPQLTRKLARSPELLVLFAITWAVVLATLGDALGFSKEVGAFLGGVSLASTPFRDSIASRLVTLRDFLLLFFFIDLGARLDLSLLGSQVGPALIFSVFVLVGNPLIVMIIMGVMGYRKRTGFLAGLTVAQISEFSLVLGALGVSLGHLQAETMGLITLVGLITITLSTYMIIYSAPLYQALSRYLGIFERRRPYRELQADSVGEMEALDAIIFGLGSYGGALARTLHERGKRVVGIDFDPEALARAREQQVPVLYGDAEDPELFEHLPLDKTRWVVDATGQVESGITLLHVLQARGFAGRVALTARTPEDQARLQGVGADLVLCPFMEAGEQAADALTDALHHLPEEVLWPISLREVRLRADSRLSGRRLRELPLRAETGVTVIAVSRAGRTLFDPAPDLQLFPEDRLVLLGQPESLAHAEAYLHQRETPSEEAAEEFGARHVVVPPQSPWAGRTLAELEFRQAYGVSVIGIERGGERLASPAGDEALQAGDHLIVVGPRPALDQLPVG